MPTSTCEPVNAALRHALSNYPTESSNNLLDSKLVGSAKRVLLSRIEFEEAESYQSTVLDSLKSKYIVLGPANNNSNNKIKANSENESSKSKMTPEPDRLTEPRQVLFPIKSVTLGWKDSSWCVGSGLTNTGNTCYLNSTLQALFHVPALVNWLTLDSSHRSHCEPDSGCIVCAVSRTLIQTQKQEPSVRPFLITSKLRIVCRHLVPGRQEDAHEFLRYLVEAMERSYLNRFRSMNLDARSKETTPLNQIFGGYLRSAVQCLQCNHVSTTIQHFQDLLLDIRKASTLDDALASYFARERLDDLSYRCESCQRKVAANKQFSLERAPMVLCLQLKRFSGQGGKITKNIAFEQRLNLTPFLRSRPGTPLIYRLVSMVIHMGPSANCGHYTAIGVAPNGNFYLFDDSIVRSVTHQYVFSANAYIMFYELEKNSLANLDSTKDNCKDIIKYEVGKSVLNGKSSSSVTSKSFKSFYSKTIESPRTVSPLKIESVKTNNKPSETCVNSTNSKSLSLFNNSTENRKSISPSRNTNGTIVLKLQNNDQRHSSPSKNDSSNKNDIRFLSIKNENKHNMTPFPSPSRTDSSSSKSLLYITSKNQENEKTSSSEKNNNSSRLTFPLLKSSPNIKSNGVNNGTGTLANGANKDRRLVPYSSEDTSSGSENEDAPSTIRSIPRDDAGTTSLNDEASWDKRKTKAAQSSSTSQEQENNIATVSQLKRMSHSGYGSSVSSWTGGRSQLEKEVNDDRRNQFKRHASDTDIEDSGRGKKIRHGSNSVPRSNPGYNPFQEYQNSRRWQNRNDHFRKGFYNSRGQQHRRRNRNTFYHHNPQNRFQR